MFSKWRKQHESPFGRDRERSGFRAVLGILFREREILIRSDGEVRFLVVGPKSQMAACAVLVIGVIWAASAIPLTVTQGFTNATNTAQILEAKIAYEDLVSEIEEYQDTVDRARFALGESRALLETQIGEAEEAEQQLALAGETLAGPRNAVAGSRVAMRGHLDRVNGVLASIANDGEELESMLAKVRADLAAGEDGRILVARARARLQERADGLEVRLVTVVEENQKIERSNSELSTGLRMTTAERDGLLENRATLRARIVSLETGLSALEVERRRIDANNDALTVDLEASRAEASDLAVERESLQELIAGLDSELQLTGAETDILKDDLREVVLGLQKVTGDSGDIDDTRLALRTGIDSLLAELSNQQAAEEVVLQRAAERSADSIGDIEKIIAMAGLDVDRLLARASIEGAGQGGPFIVASGGEALLGDELGGTMLSLENNMTRWESLKDVLRAMPLALPVDYYRITSAFGPRSDPVNGRRSMHRGLDMAAWMKSSVWAPAPGVVVYSGRKGRYGNVVELDHGFGIRTRYAHLNKTLVEVGDIVGHRQRIALLGSSGRSTGPHLHYEVHFDGKSLNPMNFIKAGRYVFKN